MPRWTAALCPKNLPPSENESGVTFNTPMIIPRFERSTTFSPISQSRLVIKIRLTRLAAYSNRAN